MEDSFEVDGTCETVNETEVCDAYVEEAQLSPEQTTCSTDCNATSSRRLASEEDPTARRLSDESTVSFIIFTAINSTEEAEAILQRLNNNTFLPALIRRLANKTYAKNFGVRRKGGPSRRRRFVCPSSGCPFRYRNDLGSFAELKVGVAMLRLSLSGQLLELSLVPTSPLSGVPIPRARSYDESPWEAVPPTSMEGEPFDDAPSIAQLDGCSSVWCATMIIETPGYVYRLYTYSDDDDQDGARRLEASDDPPVRRRRASSGSTDASRAKKYAAKLLEQTTFGPTAAEIARLSMGLQQAATGMSGTAREDAYAGVAREWVRADAGERDLAPRIRPQAVAEARPPGSKPHLGRRAALVRAGHALAPASD